MNYLKLESVKRYCVFVIKMEKPLDTMEKVLVFFEERSVWVESFQFHRIEGGEAKVLMHCLVEKDRIPHTRQKLEHMRGVLELQLLENREHNSTTKT